MNKLKRLIKNPRVIMLFVFLILALVAIHPNPYADGVTIRTVTKNSSASLAGIESAKPQTPPMNRERILYIGNEPVKELSDYYDFVSQLTPERTFNVKTTKGLYKMTTIPRTRTIILPELVEKNITEIIEINETVNGTLQTVNKTINRTIIVNKTETEIIGMHDIGLQVYEAPTSNIRKGLDLQGGTRVLLRPEKAVTSEEMGIVIDNLKQRLNVYGLSDVIVRSTKDLSGEEYISVEVAGANEEEVKELLSRQGKFEARIANNTVFTGGKNDITYICRSADCSGIDPQVGCGQSGGFWNCRFRFSIALSPSAAQRQANTTQSLDVITLQGEEYLSEKLDLYLDNELVDSLNIGSGLKGSAVTDITISGSGGGSTREEAIFDSLKGMKKLQTILVTGSLPVKLDIVKTDNISPMLGEEFLKNAMLVGVLAIIAVALVIFARYRKIQVTVPMIITMFSEVILLLGLAALIGWNLDLAAIAGIIIAVGTGIDHQIIITDETLRGEKDRFTNWKQQLKKAFFIIMGSYFTTVVAMIPLWFAGAGLLKGFAIITIFGVTFGVFVTRPAFAAIIEILLRR